MLVERRGPDPRLVAAWALLVLVTALVVVRPEVLAPSLLLVIPMAASTFGSVRAVAWLSGATLLVALPITAVQAADPPWIVTTRALAWCLILAVTVALTRGRVRREAEASYFAALDPLTGLANRRLLDEHLRWTGHLRGATGAVLCLDLDGFKAVNDRWGHGIGDVVLATVAERMGGCVRAGDLLARVGGDEFVISCVDVRGADDVGKICDRLLDAVARPIATDRGPVVVTATIGALVVPPGSQLGPSELLREADQLLIDQKSSAKGAYRLLVRH